jgi:hypothetical protein
MCPDDRMMLKPVRVRGIVIKSDSDDIDVTNALEFNCVRSHKDVLRLLSDIHDTGHPGSFSNMSIERTIEWLTDFNAARPVIETDIDPREAVVDHDEEEQKAMAWEEERRERLYEQYRDVPRPTAISNILIHGGEPLSSKKRHLVLLIKNIRRATVSVGTYRKGGNYSDPAWNAMLTIDYAGQDKTINIYYDTENEALTVLMEITRAMELYEYAKNDLTLHGDCISDTIGAMAWGRKEDA